MRTRLLIGADVWVRLHADPVEYERFLNEEVDALERAYLMGTPPEIVGWAAGDRHVAVAGIADWPSIQHARLRGLIGQMLVAGGGSQDSMAEAERHLVAAIDELCSVNDWSRATMKLLAELVLNHAVTLKARRRVPDAVAVLRGTMTDRALAPYWALGDYLPLTRQDVIMAGGLVPHRWLAEQHDAMRAAGPLEHYRTIKRLFEFAMNIGRTGACTRLLPASLKAFAPVAKRVPPLAKISLIKNIGQYEALAGRRDRALRLLNLARMAAGENNLWGQVRQIETLTERIEAGERPVLDTFLVA